MHIIKLLGDNSQIISCKEILKNRGIPYKELDEEFNVINSLNNTKVIEVLESRSAKKLTKKTKKLIKSYQEKGMVLIDVKHSSCQHGNYSSILSLTLMFN